MRTFKKIMIIFLIVLAVLAITVFLFIQQKSFGRSPEGKRLDRISKSPNYAGKTFKNLSETPMMMEDASYIKMLKNFIWSQPGTEPDQPIPSVKRNLKEPDTDKTTITWFGHSSLLIQSKGENFLIDPVFSDRASPVPYAGSKSFPGAGLYSVEDMPQIDYVIITHDHYDHLDYGTIVQFKNGGAKFYTPLGVGAHLESWGIDSARITELDWWDEAQVLPDVKLIAAPARHFSGRSLTDRNKTLWASFVFLLHGQKIYIGGDSGYDKHFKEIGQKYGPFDLVLLESGQYNAYWPYIHMMPEQTAQAAADLKGKVLLPVHWAKFKLAMHPWDEPIRRVTEKAEALHVKTTTPMIGEKVVIDSIYPSEKWWEK